VLEWAAAGELGVRRSSAGVSQASRNVVAVLWCCRRRPFSLRAIANRLHGDDAFRRATVTNSQFHPGSCRPRARAVRSAVGSPRRSDPLPLDAAHTGFSLFAKAGTKKRRRIAKYRNRIPRRCSIQVELVWERKRLVGESITDMPHMPDMLHALGDAEGVQGMRSLSDSQLLEQFALHRNERAFEALLHRHGPLVFSVCRRMLFHRQDAEDAFQATFLVLARKAGGITRRSLLSNWLYGVALRVAGRARKNALRRRAREPQDGDLAAVTREEMSANPELAALLHEEVQRLPDKYRKPVVLCYLEGRTNEEAAAQLQWPVGTVKTRLARAREMLCARLTRRGVALTAVLLLAGTLPAAVPAALLEGTFRASLKFAAGTASAVGAATPQSLALATGVLRAMLLTKLKTLSAGVLAVVLAGVGGLAYHGLAADPPSKDDKKAAAPKEDKDAILGTWVVEAVEVEGRDMSDTDEGKKIKGSVLTVTADEMTIVTMEGGGKKTTYKYKLNPAVKPKAIDRIDGADSIESVYSLDGDTLKICAPMMKDGPRPTEVATREGSNTSLFVLKRQAKEKK